MKTAKTPDENAVLADAWLRLVDELLTADQYDNAERTVSNAVQCARKSSDSSLVAQSTSRTKEVAEAKALFQTMKAVLEALARNPEDPKANSEVGRFLCYVKGSWDLGLRFMARGADADIRALAERELAPPMQVADWVAVADGWFELLEKEKSPLRKAQLGSHARVLYESVVSNTTGLVKARIEKRLSDLSFDPSPRRVITFRSEDKLGLFVTSGGTWRISDGELIGSCPGDTQWATYKTAFSAISSITVRGRIVPPAKFDFRLWVGTIHLIFNWAGGDQNHYRNGAALGKTSPSVLVPGKESEITLQAQGTKIILSVDGKKQWETEGSLNGTVSFQASLGSSMGIRQISIEGTPDPAKRVEPVSRQLP